MSGYIYCATVANLEKKVGRLGPGSVLLLLLFLGWDPRIRSVCMVCLNFLNGSTFIASYAYLPIVSFQGRYLPAQLD